MSSVRSLSRKLERRVGQIGALIVEVNHAKTRIAEQNTKISALLDNRTEASDTARRLRDAINENKRLSDALAIAHTRIYEANAQTHKAAEDACRIEAKRLRLREICLKYKEKLQEAKTRMVEAETYITSMNEGFYEGWAFAERSSLPSEDQGRTMRSSHHCSCVCSSVKSRKSKTNSRKGMLLPWIRTGPALTNL